MFSYIHSFVRLPENRLPEEFVQDLNRYKVKAILLPDGIIHPNGVWDKGSIQPQTAC